jgi:tRNA threonylcarbamoyladenosine biosynthesis protein TsaB
MIEYTGKTPEAPLILNIESATDVCSVCLSHGMEVLSEQLSGGKNEHSSVITLLIKRCMEEARLTLKELDAVAVSEGPGSYTSLRVGFSTAKGICFALNKPLITISTLEALAWASCQLELDADAIYCPMIDARRMEVYMALFSAEGNLILPAQAMIIDHAAFKRYFSIGQRIIFCGNGVEKCKTIFSNKFSSFSGVKNCDSVQLISGAMKAFLNKNFADTAYAAPCYLKAPNITSAKQKPR